VGAAFRAGLSGIRLIAAPTTDSDEATGISYRSDINHIYSNSWGPTDDGKRLEGPGNLAKLALENAIRNGRGAKGSIYVWAGGNGRTSGDNCNYDGWANSRYTIAVAAVDDTGKQAWYSEECSALVISAPSSGRTTSITTTDLLGTKGSSSSDCTSKFGGTSAAAPLVAGVVAQILSANPRLGWRDVQHILISTAKRVDITDSDWQRNGAGFYVSHKYGFGLVNADAATSLALRYTNKRPFNTLDSRVIRVGQNIPDNLAGSVTQEWRITSPLTVEHVEIIIDATHPARGDLVISLTSPYGTKSRLAEKRNDIKADYANWKFMSIFSWGESAQGVWKLTIQDSKPGNTGRLNSWQLIIYGT
jgi:subtilisin family serine protease